MPGMPRIPGKGTKIAYKILGVPQNMKDTKMTEQGVIVSKKPGMGAGSKIDQRLLFEETQRVR